MSTSFNLIKVENQKLIPNEEALSYIKSIKEKLNIIGIISSKDDPIKLSFLSKIPNPESEDDIQYSKPQILSIFDMNLKKENYNAKILFLDINSDDDFMFSLAFFSCALFLLCLEGNLNSNEINKLSAVNNLINTIKLKNKNNLEKELFLTECAPKLIFYTRNSKSSFSNFYLEEELNRKESDKNLNLIKENILKYFLKKEFFSENFENNPGFIEKIIEKTNIKEINGKYIDGNSFAFFVQNFCDMHNNKKIIDFRYLFGNLIYNDIHTYKSKALNYFEENVKKLENENEELLIPKIYDIKIKAIEIYNSVQSLIYKLFNNYEYKEYKTSFNEIKKELENKFTEIENKKLIENLKKSELICNELLNKHYETINKKLVNGKYNKSNSEEYMEDYKNFLKEYEKEAIGNNKIKCLINFLEINKPKYFKSLIYNEGEGNILNMNNSNSDIDAQDDIKNKLSRKKREIDNLKDQIGRIEEEIKKVKIIEESSKKLNTNINIKEIK